MSCATPAIMTNTSHMTIQVARVFGHAPKNVQVGPGPSERGCQLLLKTLRGGVSSDYASTLISMRGGPTTPALAMASLKSGSLAKACALSTEENQ